MITLEIVSRRMVLLRGLITRFKLFEREDEVTANVQVFPKAG